MITHICDTVEDVSRVLRHDIVGLVSGKVEDGLRGGLFCVRIVESELEMMERRGEEMWREGSLCLYS